jgi:hypothetical protein
VLKYSINPITNPNTFYSYTQSRDNIMGTKISVPTDIVEHKRLLFHKFASQSLTYRSPWKGWALQRADAVSGTQISILIFRNREVSPRAQQESTEEQTLVLPEVAQTYIQPSAPPDRTDEEAKSLYLLTMDLSLYTDWALALTVCGRVAVP